MVNVSFSWRILKAITSISCVGFIVVIFFTWINQLCHIFHSFYDSNICRNPTYYRVRHSVCFLEYLSNYHYPLSLESCVFILFPSRFGVWFSVFRTWFHQNFLIFLNHKVLALALRNLWFCSIEKPKFQANSCPEIPKII